MPRTQLDKRGLANHTLTGASFRTELEVYDEISSYVVDDIVLWKNGSWRALASIASTTEGDLSLSPDNNNNWERITAPKYNAYPSVSQTFNDIPVDLILDTERTPDQLNRLEIVSNSIQFNTADTFMVSADVSLNNLSGTRAISKGYLQLSTNSGASWTTIPNSEMWCYNRNSTQGTTTGSVTLPVVVNSGDRIKIVVKCTTTTSLTTVPAGCNLTVFTTVGGSGPRGIQGPVGPTGDLNWKGNWSSTGIYSVRETVYYLGSSYTSTTNGNTETPSASALNWDLIALKGTDGSGTNISISDEGVSIPSTPHSQIDFTGVDVTVTDAGGGVANVDIQPSKHKYMVPIWAEENASLGANTYEWAFGNGANTSVNKGPAIYVPAGYTARIASVGLTLGAGSATIRVELDGVDSGASCSTDVSVNSSNIQEPGSNIYITSNTRLNFKTVSATGTSAPCVAICWIEFSEN